MNSKYSCITKRKAIDQYGMLQKFRDGALNTIITTSVLEEGIDLPVCSTVIRYNIPNNFRQYVQSRGRARQDVSSIVFLCQFGKEYIELRDTLNKYNDFEVTLKETLGEKTIRAEVLRTRPTKEIHQEDKEDYIIADEGRIRVDCRTAKTILNMYCSHLSKDIPFTEGVRYDRLNIDGGLFQTILYLPSTCPIVEEGIKGGIKSSEELADSSAIVTAVRFLRSNGELNENFAPTRRTDKNLDGILASIGLEPKMEPLDSSLEGIVKKTRSEQEVMLFEPILSQIPNFLSRDYTKRSYKLIRIGFMSTSLATRLDTKRYFEKSVFGLIIDQSTDLGFIPSHIYSHYGQFEVRFKEISLESSGPFLKDYREHNDFLSYTHRFLSKCLTISHLKKDELRNHSLFYIIPLGDDDKPDQMKLRNSFYGGHRALKVDDIVKARNIGQDRRQRDDDRLLMIKAIRGDLSETSLIPGKNITFLDDVDYKYGDKFRVQRNQRVYEVIPISKDYGHIKREQAKTTRADYTTSSLFYLEQFLEHFDDDPCTAFQAYLLPEIIYRLYLTYMAQELDKNFVQKTSQQREHTRHYAIQEKELDEGVVESLDKGLIMSAEEVGDDHSHASDESDESDSDDMTSGSEDDEDETNVDQDYFEMINKRTLDMNDNGDNSEELKRWDLSGYCAPNLNFLERIETKDSALLREATLDQTHFGALELTVKNLTSDLVSEIELFGKFLTADTTFLDEDSELKSRTAFVDKSIEPPIKFDRCTKPLKEGSRVSSLLEALTQRRAQESFNLEGLENVGDSYLKYAASVALFLRLDGNEGFLSAARSRLTCNNYFTYLAKKKRLGAFAITSSFSKEKFFMYIGKSLDKPKMMQAYNKMRPKNLADTFEAIIGAYLVYHSEFEATLAIEWLGLDIFSTGIFEERHENAVIFAKAPSAMTEPSESRELFKSLKLKLRKFEKILGYEFNDASYLFQAMSHASSLHKITRSYERLEFLGDAILDLLTTLTLVKRTGMNDPGQMTSSRSALVNNVNFARLAMKYKYDIFIQHSNHELYDELNKVRLAMEEDPEMLFLDMTDFDKIVKLLGDVFESVAGAIYLDSGNSLDTVWSVYYPMLKESFDSEIEKPTKNFAVQLYENFPGPERISFDTFEAQNEEGETIVGVKCRIIGFEDVTKFRDFEGLGMSKKQAKQRAIQEAIRNLPPREKLVQLNKAYKELYSDKFAIGPPRNRSGRGGRGGGDRQRGGYTSRRPSFNSRSRGSSGNWRKT